MFACKIGHMRTNYHEDPEIERTNLGTRSMRIQLKKERRADRKRGGPEKGGAKAALVCDGFEIKTFSRKSC